MLLRFYDPYDGESAAVWRKPASP